MKDLVMFHANCTDGIFAAYAHWSSKGAPVDTIYYPVSYGPTWTETLEKLKDAVPDLNERRVRILDFSFSPEDIVELADLSGWVTLLDHHKSAMEKYKELGRLSEDGNILEATLNGNVYIYFDLTRSGAVIAYQYFNDKESHVPVYYQWVQDRDLWRFTLSDTRDFGAGIRFIMGTTLFDKPEHFVILDEALSDVAEVLSKGNVMESIRDIRIDKHISQSINLTTLRFGDCEFKAGFKNADYDIASDLANRFIEQEGLDIVVIYSITVKNTVACSVRSSKGVDSTFFSLHHGGGGHPQANGCELSMDELLVYLHEDTVSIDS